MSASLVGSEMCIRDRTSGARAMAALALLVQQPPLDSPLAPPSPASQEAVSYTHLTLPTICSV
eukprot:658384-Alexandrium_andersonii.AAC.1